MSSATAVALGAQARPSGALLGRGADFWLLGGASIATWLAFALVEPLRGDSPIVDQYMKALGPTAAALTIVANKPHFMASYMLAYGRGGRFVLGRWFQLVAVPVGLIVLIGLGLGNYHDTGHAGGAFAPVRGALAALGARAGFGAATGSGQILLGLLVALMLLSVGWHYSKQTYGCMMVYAKFDGYPLAPRQRAIIRWSLHAVWASNFCYINALPYPGDFHGVPSPRLGLPGWVATGATLVCVAAFLVTVQTVLVRNRLAHGRTPSANFLVPYLAFALWWTPPLIQKDLFIYLVPFFHSLQYLPFVHKMESRRLGATRPDTARARGIVAAFALVAAGFLAFDLLPDTADALAGTWKRLGIGAFVMAAALFINIHHYFIDNVLWRFRDPEVREYLLA